MREDSSTIRVDAWKRYGWVTSPLFYLFLLGSTIFALADTEWAPLQPGQKGWVLGLALVSGIWHWLGAIYLARHFQPIRHYPWFTCGRLIVDAILWFFLIRIHPAFYLLIATFHIQIYYFLTLEWAIPVSILSNLMLLDFSALSWQSGRLWPFLIISIGGTFVGFWITAIIRQSRQRRELLEQLAQTQAELLAAERQAGVLTERQRLAHEIHDTLAQGLASVVMHLEAAEQRFVTIPAPSQHHLDQARDIARDSLTEARRWVWALQPTQLEQGALPEAIERLATSWTEANHIPATTTITGQRQLLHPEMEVTFLRVAQEALANIRKHAAAKAVTITLSYMEDLVILDVQDDGVGFQPAQQLADLLSMNGGYGLQAMSQRLFQLGGSLEIESATGEGTTVVAQIPI